MALERKDRAGDTSATTGTGTLTLDGAAPAGLRTFSAAGYTTGATVRYLIANASMSEWEVGEGAWTSSGSTLTRVTVYASTNAGALVNFSAGTKNVTAVMTVADLSAYSGCRAYNNATQSITSGVTTLVTFNSEEWDTDAIHSTSTNTSRFTVPTGKAGKWRFTWHLTYAANATGQRIAWLRKNAAGSGSNTDNVIGSADYRSGAVITSPQGSSVLDMAAGDYVELFTYQDSGSTLNLGAATGGSTNAEVSTMEAQFLG